MIKNNNDILWIFSWPNPEIIPSYVVSGIMSADYLKIQKVIFLESHDPKNFLLELYRLQNLPVCNSTQSAPNFLAFLMS